MKIVRAISIRQPFAELILRGKKVREFRSVPTNIRERVYVYASLKPRPESEFLEVGLRRRDLPVGLIVGSVEIVGCEDLGEDGYAYVLENPKRLRALLKPKNQPQPIWFRPFD